MTMNITYGNSLRFDARYLTGNATSGAAKSDVAAGHKDDANSSDLGLNLLYRIAGV